MSLVLNLLSYSCLEVLQHEPHKFCSHVSAELLTSLIAILEDRHYKLLKLSKPLFKQPDNYIVT